MTSDIVRRHEVAEHLTIEAAQLCSAWHLRGSRHTDAYYKLHSAYHAGWRCGFEERGEIYKEHGPSMRALCAIYWLLGAMCGIAVIVQFIR